MKSKMIPMKSRTCLGGARYEVQTLSYLKGLMESCSPETFKEVIDRLVRTAKNGQDEYAIKASALLIKTMMTLFELYPARAELPGESANARTTYTRQVLTQTCKQLTEAQNKTELTMNRIGDAPSA